MNILIVDDHPLIHRGLAQMLGDETDIRVTGNADGAGAALALLRSAPFDIVILDINLPDLNGLDLLRVIRKTYPALPILALSIHPEGSVALRAIKAGANGYLCKQSAAEEVVTAVRRLAAGASYVSAKLADMLVLELGGRTLPNAHDKLTDREYQVMCMLATGKAIIEIADLLHRSPNTISTHRTRVLEKMGMVTNAELTRYAVAHQLID